MQDPIEATTFELLPADDSNLTYEGQFRLGYKAEDDSPMMKVNGLQINPSGSPRSRFNLALTLSSTEEENVYPLIGILSPYYRYYKANGDRKMR